MRVILNIISTINGMKNEGMRNVASHIIDNLDGMCEIRRSPLNNFALCMKNSKGADAVLIFARATTKTAYLTKAVRLFCKKVYFVLVQKPERGFLKLAGKKAGNVSYFTIFPADGAALRAKGATVYPLAVGIDREKFRPAESEAEIISLRRKYGFEDDKPIVLHVGHLSEGRGLEVFENLPKERFQNIVVASGMFNSDKVENFLHTEGVTIVKEYISDISEIYRMADVYLFPTRSAEFVISIPLSVTEALACGTPVVAFNGVAGLDLVEPVQTDALVRISDREELDAAVTATANCYKGNCRNLLDKMGSWKDAANHLFGCILSNIESK